MAESEDRWILHYGGQDFDITEYGGDPLREYDGTSSGTLQMNLGSKGWLTIALGPGIPIAVTRRKAGAGDSRHAIVV